jgi:hypothetical protein
LSGQINNYAPAPTSFPADSSIISPTAAQPSMSIRC